MRVVVPAIQVCYFTYCLYSFNVIEARGPPSFSSAVSLTLARRQRGCRTSLEDNSRDDTCTKMNIKTQKGIFKRHVEITALFLNANNLYRKKSIAEIVHAMQRSIDLKEGLALATAMSVIPKSI